MLAFFVNTLVVYNYTPETDFEVPIIAIYFMFNIFLLSISVGASVVVLNFHFRGHRKTKVPGWLKRLFSIDSTSTNLEQINLDLIKIRRNWSFFSQDQLSILINSNKKRQIRKENINGCNLVLNMQNGRSNSPNKLQNVKFKSNFKYSKTLKSIQRSLLILESSFIRSKENLLIFAEWKELALRLDRILFVITTFIAFAVPVLLFAKFYLKDYSLSTFERNLACEC
jgi:hypothetical protein